MNLYAESTAILSWLLQEDEAPQIQQALAEAKLVVTSDLTILECERSLIRMEASGQYKEGTLSDRRVLLADAAAHWNYLRIDEDVINRARLRFTDEPLRTAEAVHLAAALVFRSVVPDLAFLSVDQRIRSNSRRLGFAILP